MPKTPPGYSPKYWRSKAREARANAHGSTTEANRRQLLAVALHCDRLAYEAEREEALAKRRAVHLSEEA